MYSSVAYKGLGSFLESGGVKQGRSSLESPETELAGAQALKTNEISNVSGLLLYHPNERNE